MVGVRKQAAVPRAAKGQPGPDTVSWTFLTNHTHVLLCLARDPEMRMRDVAVAVGVTERAVQRIVQDLEEAGYLSRERDGRRNIYEIYAGRPLRHPLEAHCDVAQVLAVLGASVKPQRAARK